MTEGGETRLGVVLFRLLAAVAVGTVVAATYLGSQRRPAREALPFVTTLVLLTVLVSMTTLVIGNSVARAFSLVGALAIVRFRTVVEDTRDTAFVIFAVASGMAIGAGYFAIGLLGVATVSAAALALSAWGRRLGDPAVKAERALMVRVGSGRDPDSLLGAAFRSHLIGTRLRSTVTARQGAALDLHYAIRLLKPDGALALVRELQALEGVQHVELDAR